MVALFVSFFPIVTSASRVRLGELGFGSSESQERADQRKNDRK